MLAAPVLAMAGLGLAWLLGKGSHPASAFVASSLGIAGALLTIGFGMFPFLLISTTDPRSSLTLWDGTARHLTMLWAFWIIVVFLPLVLAYTGWVYNVIWGKVTEAQVIRNTHGIDQSCDTLRK